jgi:predicted deacylase
MSGSSIFTKHAARMLIALVLTGSALQAIASEPVTSIQVGTAIAKPGQVSRGAILIEAGSDPGYSIPVVVANGARPGPTLALVAGLHGAEFASIVALQKLSAQIDASQLSGKVIIVPLVNVAAFDAVVRHLNPVDGKNINRVFPGSVSGTQSERAAYALTTQVIEQADYVIDYHGGDIDEDQHPYAYWIQTGAAQLDASELDMLLAYGPDYIIKFAAAGLTLETAKLLPTQAAARGKPTITVDAGRAGTYTAADLATLIDGTLNVMASLEMLDRPVKASKKPTFIERFLYVKSDGTGTFYPLAGRGQHVTKGQKIGYVTDRYGMPSFDVVAPESAVVLYLNSTPSAVQGEQLFYLGVPAQGDPPHSGR